MDPQDGGTFEEIIARGGELPSHPQSRTEDVISESELFNEEYETMDDNGDSITERFECKTRRVSVLDGNGQFPLFDSGSDVIYPGSLLQGATLSNTTPSPIVVRRAGGTISYNLNNGNLNSTFSVDEVKKSTIQNGMNTIIANAGDVVPANFQLDIIQVESEQQMALELGIDVERYNTKVSADMSFSSDKSYNRMLVKLNQSYYTMSFDLPTSLDQVFHPEVTPDQLSTYVQEDNPATFISSVTYGRIFYMLVESTSSREEMSAKLDASYQKFKNKVEGELDAESMQSLNNLKIKVIAYGGDTEGTFQLTGETSVSAIANKLAESTEIKAGLPLSYVVRSVERPDQIAGTKLAAEYDVVECELKGTLPPSNLLPLVDLFYDDSDGGGIGAMINISGPNTLVFNKSGDKYVWYNADVGNVKGMFSIHDANSPLGILPFDAVGAGVQHSESMLYFFNQTGLLYAIMDYSQSGLAGDIDPPTSPLGIMRTDNNGDVTQYATGGTFGDSPGFQFAGLGFEAASKVGSDITAYFPKPGDQYAIYNKADGGQWWGVHSSTNWFQGQDHTGEPLFDKVGAASSLTIGGATVIYYLVNDTGDQIMMYTNNGNRIMKGPWVIN